MIEYRQDRMIGTLYRRVAGTPEEYDGRTKEWKLTGQALAAYGPSSDTRRISEEDAMKEIARLAEFYGNKE
ncbi:MAG: hypothetical protein WBK59_04425 [Acholeplasmatales bacterium]|jgi:hypothetical protein